jgi:TRAP-type mannitol/chloroaromatic compound transport system permease small subunit
MKNMTAKICKTIEMINDWAGKLASFLLIVLACLVAYEVMMRYFFNRPTIWSMELNGYLLLIVSFIGGGYTLSHGAHVSVDILYSKINLRAGVWLDLLHLLIVLSACIPLVWFGSVSACESLIHGFRTDSTWAPLMWPSKIVVPLGGLLLGIQFLAQFIQKWFLGMKK